MVWKVRNGEILSNDKLGLCDKVCLFVIVQIWMRNKVALKQLDCGVERDIKKV